MDFIKLFNGVVVRAKPVTAADSFAQSLDDKLEDLNLDSLDYIMVSMYFGELYGIEEDTMRELSAMSVGDLQAFLLLHKTTEPSSAEAGLEQIK
jgi:acyl carrier protein